MLARRGFFLYAHLAGSASMDIFIQQLINGLTLGSVYALVALGYTMVYGIIGLINFAHGDVVMIGAMAATMIASAMVGGDRSEEHTSELQSLMRISYAVFCLKKKK